MTPPLRAFYPGRAFLLLGAFAMLTFAAMLLAAETGPGAIPPKTNPADASAYTRSTTYTARTDAINAATRGSGAPVGAKVGAGGAARAEEGFVDRETPKDAQPAGPKGHWILTFSDEFNAGTLNPAKWKALTAIRGGGDGKKNNGNHGVEWGWDAANVSMDKIAGHLVIETKKDGENKFSSGCISSKGLFSQRYGFFEARLKSPPKNNGHQAAFWLTPIGDQMGVGKPGAEIDVIETHLAADKGTSTLHWNGYKEGEHRSASKTWDGPGLHEGFHTYGVEWTPQLIRVYYDGQPVWTHEGKGVPTVEECILCSVGILNWVDGNIRTAQLPQRTLFDWVRVYAHSPRE